MEEADAAMARALGQPGGTYQWNLVNEAVAARWTAFPPLFDARATVNTAASRYNNDDADYDDEVDEGKEDEVEVVGAMASSSSALEVTSWLEDIMFSPHPTNNLMHRQILHNSTQFYTILQSSTKFYKILQRALDSSCRISTIIANLIHPM
eukprot:scaffold39641_cov49-Attheya_sp.AAC.1